MVRHWPFPGKKARAYLAIESRKSDACNDGLGLIECGPIEREEELEFFREVSLRELLAEYEHK